MRFRWPEDTVFERLVLDVEEESCAVCGRGLHICDHRFHPIFTLRGPLELCCRLAHCSDRHCPARSRTLSPPAELTLTLPRWLLGWDVFCWMGQRRFARHWSVPQIRDELRDTYRIPVSKDGLSIYLGRYQTMLAARQHDPVQLEQAYRGIDTLVLSIDGLQPEKGHETLYAVRELNAKRVWFAEPLISSSADEVRRLLVRAREFAQRLGKPVQLWLSDKQDAFVKGIAAEFDGVPHRYCQNHFLRDLAKPTLEQDSHAKVQMRKQVRGLRDVERAVLEDRRQAEAGTTDGTGLPATADAAEGDADGGTGLPATADAVEGDADGGTGLPATAGAAEGDADGVAAAEREAELPKQTASAGSAADVAEADAGPSAAADSAAEDPAGDVVLDYCAALRGILNDDQGGPLEPPGLRMAEALGEVRASLGRNLAENQAGPAHQHLERLAACIDRGLAAVRDEHEQVRAQVEEIRKVAATLDEKAGPRCRRQARFERLQQKYHKKGGAFYGHLATLMRNWAAGLFVPVKGAAPGGLPQDNLDLERWFRRPKGHERRIHGHKHAGVRIVQEGATLLLVLNAHEAHPEPFQAQELLPYRNARAPTEQRQAIQRRKVMRKARSRKKRPKLLAELEGRYRGLI